MNEITIFNNPEFGSVRMIEMNGEPYFVGKDVAEILGYSDTNKAVAMHVDNEDKILNDKSSPSFGQRGATLINESGLYSLILLSKLPEAKKFKRWVTSEILPSIRKTGSYSIEQKPDSYMIADPVERAKRWIEEEQERQALVTKNVELEQKIKEDTPLVDFAVQVSQKSDTISMNEMAKIIHDENIPIGRNMLFRWLRNKGILMENNMPYQRYITDGYFKVKTAAKFTSYGVKHFPKTVVTGKGQIYIVQKLKAEYGMINKEED